MTESKLHMTDIVHFQLETKPTALKKKKAEYHEFVYRQWTLDQTWVCLANGEHTTLSPARDFFWQTYRPQILDELQKWHDDGWEVAEEPGAKNFRLRSVESVNNAIDPSDILLWIMTLGIALLMRFWVRESPRRYVTYEPIEFRLRLRRTYNV